MQIMDRDLNGHHCVVRHSGDMLLKIQILDNTDNVDVTLLMNGIPTATLRSTGGEHNLVDFANLCPVLVALVSANGPYVRGCSV
jgi:hypothetical protein